MVAGSSRCSCRCAALCFRFARCAASGAHAVHAVVSGGACQRIWVGNRRLWGGEGEAGRRQGCLKHVATGPFPDDAAFPATPAHTKQSRLTRSAGLRARAARLSCTHKVWRGNEHMFDSHTQGLARE